MYAAVRNMEKSRKMRESIDMGGEVRCEITEWTSGDAKRGRTN
jgi:hypothetical protein